MKSSVAIVATANPSVAQAYGDKEAELIGICATAAIMAVLLIFAILPLFFRKRNPSAKKAASKD
ncbi:MAG TPA: hypothetical protein PKA31_03655 [Candidatus Moranbacteria bacterium]|nr:hypothetical protein [Candidatus Moranbacteria bacterium]